MKIAYGSNLPYKGTVKLEIISDGLGDEKEYRCLLLVVNDTEYHKNVPVLLGTNILNSIMEGIKEYHGDRYMQTTKLHVPWF